MPQMGIRYPAQRVVESKEKFFLEETISELRLKELNCWFFNRLIWGERKEKTFQEKGLSKTRVWVFYLFYV